MKYFSIGILFLHLVFINVIVRVTLPMATSQNALSKQANRVKKGFSNIKTDELTKLCQSYLNKTYHHPEMKWSCSLMNTISNYASCFCFHDYSCIDTEEFYLEPVLIERSVYLSWENNVLYKNKCEQSLNQLTNESNWTCELQFDRMARKEFYCDCKRESVCQQHKYFTIPYSLEKEIKLLKEFLMLFSFF